MQLTAHPGEVTGCQGVVEVSRQVTNDMRMGAWRKWQASLRPIGCLSQPIFHVTWRTKLLEVVSEDVLPSDLLNRPFLLLYLP